VIASYDPAMAGRTVSPVFVGRTAQIDILTSVLDRAVEGPAVHALVLGEAGVGKTRFTSEVERLAAERGFNVLRGACVALGGMGLAYAPIAAMLRDSVQHDGDALRTSLDPSAIAALGSVAPALLTGDPPSGHAVSQARLFDALLRYFDGLATDAPVLVVIEDLHWSDPGTRDAITFLVPNLVSRRVAFVLTYRTDELDRRHPLLPWLSELDRTGRFERIELQRFDRDETTSLIAAITGTEPSAAQADRIQRRADGNAFFVEELLMAGGGGLAVGGLPTTVRATLTGRVAAAPDDVQHVLRIASVGGRYVDDELLGRVADLDRESLHAALRAAVDLHLLVPEAAERGGFAFRHALVQEAVYDDLLPGERRSLHRAFAEELAAQPVLAGAAGAARWAELAHHWRLAHDDVRAAEASLRAGEAAAGTMSYVAADHHYDGVLELWDSVPDPEHRLGLTRLQLFERAAEIAELAGEFKRMIDIVGEAITLEAGADPVRGALLRAELGRGLWLYGDTDRAVASLREAVRLLPTHEATPERAWVLARIGQILMLVDENEEAIDFCDEAIEIARSVGNRRIEGHALNSKGTSLCVLGRAAEGISVLEDSLAIAREMDSPDDVARAFVNLTDGLRLASRDREGLRRAMEGIVEIEQLGVGASYGPVIRDNGTLISFELGEWETARQLEAETLRIPQRGTNRETYHLTYSIGIAVARGDPDAASRLDRFRDLLEGRISMEGQFAGQYALARAEFELWRGRPDAALAAIDDGLAWVEPKAMPHFSSLVFAMGARVDADLVERSRAARDPDIETDAVVERIDSRIAAIAAFADRVGVETGARLDVLAPLRAAEAERSRAAGAPDPARWETAIELWEARERPYDAAYARWRLAEARLGRGGRAAARDALAAAAAWARDHGAGPLLSEIESLSRRARLDLASGEPATPDPIEPPPAAADRLGLTRREREVLELVAAGLTNRQIADRLFISENTVGVHVGNILGKLDASSRTEAAGIAHRLGLVAEPAGP